jgi:hypothetical protein
MIRLERVRGDSTLPMGAGGDDVPRPSPALADPGAWPKPEGILDRMLVDGDIGSAIAALVMKSQKETRANARLARDAAYDAEAISQRQEIQHLRSAAGQRFVSSVLQGGLQLASAGASLAAAAPAARAGQLQGQLGSTMTDTSRADAILERKGVDETVGMLGGVGKGADAAATIAPAFGKLFADNQDSAAKAAAFRATQAKRTAEGNADSVRDADKSLERTLELLKDYLATRDATQAALVHRI